MISSLSSIKIELDLLNKVRPDRHLTFQLPLNPVESCPNSLERSVQMPKCSRCLQQLPISSTCTRGRHQDLSAVDKNLTTSFPLFCFRHLWQTDPSLNLSGVLTF